MGLAQSLGAMLSAPVLAAWETHIRGAVNEALDAREPAEPGELRELGVHLAMARDALDALQSELSRHEATIQALRSTPRPPSRADALALRVAGLQASSGAADDSVDRLVAGVHAVSDRLLALREPLARGDQRVAAAEISAAGAAETAGQATARLARAQSAAERPPAPRTCKVDGCEQPFRARGFCGKHYQLWKRSRLPGFVGEDGVVFFTDDGPRWTLDRAAAGEPAVLVDGEARVRR